MFRIISTLILAVAAASATASQPLTLAENAPDRHIVVPGDTLWGISGEFLKEPWRWPEIWQLNKEQIKNPHLIYPGDIVFLDTSSGTPRLRVGKAFKSNNKLEPKIYSEDSRKEIPSIPPNVIEPFISQPLVVEANELDSAPRIVATQEDRVFLSNGDKGFVAGMVDSSVIKWQVYRPGRPLKDPETLEILGYEAFYLGNAKLVEPANPSEPEQLATIEMVTVKEEVGRGDRLVPAAPPALLAYVPHKPEQEVSGLVMSVYGGVDEAGKYSIVTLNRGAQDGLEIGSVLAMFRKRNATFENEAGKKETMPLPENRYGLLFVFRTFDRVAYALVLNTSLPVIVGDAVRNP